jgi:phosphopantothenoylcysteine decarboxylase/phosphopantothenate--cysteine ligase
VGKGRLAEPDEIASAVAALVAGPKPLQGRKVLVTAGGTVERIDPVRYITNDSSGKMGFALAEAARDLGAEVTLVCARTDERPPGGMELVRVESTADMFDAVTRRLGTVDAVVKAAAVADYRPSVRHDAKIKKKEETLSLELVRNPDILQAVGEWKAAHPGERVPFIIGFAAETGGLEKFAMDKLQRKKCDLIVGNDVSLEGAGFTSDTNIVSIYGPEGLVENIPMAAKRTVAERIWQLAADRMNRE